MAAYSSWAMQNVVARMKTAAEAVRRVGRLVSGSYGLLAGTS